jgi:hypothetical protein
MKRLWRFGVLLLLFCPWALSLNAARATSLTIDEGLHIASGYTILRTGDYRLIEEHPPLTKLWLALPLLAVPDLPDPRSLPAWAEAANPTTESLPLLHMAQQLIYPYRPIDRLVFAARAPVALLAVLLGAVVFRWAKDLRGWKSGLLALFLLAFDPNILAHAAVAGTDLGAACFAALALFGLHRFLHKPTVLRLALAGVTLGLAQGAKTSAALLLPVVVLLTVLALPRRRFLYTLALLLIAGLTLWGLYGFEIGRIPGVPFPVPAASHAIPWLRLRQHTLDGHAAFLLGENRTHGWWYYFPVAFGLKTPLATLCLFMASIAIASLQVCKFAGSQIGKSANRQIPGLQPSTSNLQPQISSLQSLLRRWGPLVLFPLIYGASSLFSPLNIGYRHLLPILPCIFIFISRIADHVSRFTFYASRIMHHVSHFTFYALLAWLALGTLLISPHYLAYFNELAGGPDNGWHYLADSNTDWGQGYKDLARFQRERGLGPLRLSAFIFYDPAIYGVEYEPLTPLHGDTPAVFPSRFNPPPGDYVISATTLDGIPLVDPEMYDWFRKREPDARIAHVLFYYRVLPQDPMPGWLAQCIVPEPPLSPLVVAEGFGRTDLRLIYFDCTQTWLYPGGGQSPGWYAFYQARETESDFVRAQQAHARLAYEQHLRYDTPPFAIYETTVLPLGGGPMNGVETGPVIVAPSEWTPQQAEAEGATLSAPLSLSGPLEFLGYHLEADTAAAGETLDLWTYWSVTDVPTRPLSLMAHLLDRDGQLLAVGDGLGVQVEALRPGDLIVQRHALLIPAAAQGDLWLQAGVYWLDTLERWPVLIEERATGDRILLARVEVR